MPPSASANLPFLLRRRAGERAAHVAEQLRLEQRFRDRRAVHLDERHLALRAVVVDRARDQLLAGAGLAGDEHRALRLARPAPPCWITSCIAPAAADDAVVVELGVALADQVAVLGAQPLVLERAADDDEQLVDLERLLQVVERAELHRLDRALDRGVRGHHQDLRPLAVGRRRDAARGSDRGRSAPASGCRRRARRTSRSAEQPLRLARAAGRRRPRGRRRAAPRPAR